MSYLMPGVKAPLPLWVLGAVASLGAASGELQDRIQSQASCIRGPVVLAPLLPLALLTRRSTESAAKGAKCTTSGPGSPRPTPTPSHSLNAQSVCR